MRARSVPALFVAIPMAFLVGEAVAGGKTVWTRTTACEKQADRDAAHEALDGLGKLFEQADVKADEVSPAWDALWRQPCFALPRKLLHLKATATVAQLATWWREGGEGFLRDWVTAGEKRKEGRRRELTIPVDMRRNLTDALKSIEGRTWRNGKVPASLRCERLEESCDADAAETIATFEATVRTGERLRTQECGESAAKRRQSCLDGASKLSAREQFRSYVTCVAGGEGKRTGRYPVGGLRLPRTGWLVLQGRRGHYQFCDEWRAYDLETGSAHVVSACGGLVLEAGGQVNGAATAEGLGWSYKVGRISPDAVRRITFLLATGSLVEKERVENATIELPAGMEPVWWEADDRLGLSGHGICGWSTSAQTAIGWTWRDGATILASGRFTWPDSDEALEDDVAHRLRTAEAAVIEGCAPRALPRDFLDGAAAGGVSHLDQPKEGRTAIGEKLRAGLEAAMRVPTCVTPRTP